MKSAPHPCALCGTTVKDASRICRTCYNDGFTTDDIPAPAPKPGNVLVLCAWWRLPGIPAEDYADFIGRRFEESLLVPSIVAGCLPPGLVLERGRQCLVMGEYGKAGWVVPMGAK